MRVRSHLRFLLHTIWYYFLIHDCMYSVLGCHECYPCPGGSQPQGGISVTTCESCPAGEKEYNIVILLYTY